MKEIITTAVLVFSTNLLAGECLSPDSDPDGDGYGWENNTSCTMPEVTVTNTDVIGACLADGNDLEAENQRLRTQIAALQGSNTNQSSLCVDTAPVGDGWGWNGSTSCRVSASEATSTAGTSSDYTNVVPSCHEARERIEAHVEIGMPEADVRRLVGKPTQIDTDTNYEYGYTYHDTRYRWSVYHIVVFRAGKVKEYSTLGYSNTYCDLVDGV